MHLKRLCLAHFRNYTKEEVLFHPDVNYVEGENGSGKSTLLEAIHLLSTGKSFRTSRLLELIAYTKEGFSLEAEFFKDDIAYSVRILYSTEGRKLFLNETSYSSFLPLFGMLPSVLLSSEDIAILKGGPSERRRFLDLHIAQIDPLYLHHLGRYERALKQRNYLLKKKDVRGILPWEELMAVSASYLIKKRGETLHFFVEPCNKHIACFSEEKELFSLQYISSLESEESSSYLKQWEKSRAKDLEIGSTLLGPHRDDILFFLQGKEAKNYGSEGQKRCLLAALRLAQWEHLKKFNQESPLFCIDDFGAHLDKERSFRLQQTLKQMGQVFLTAPSFGLQTDELVLQTFSGSIRQESRKNFALRE